MRRRRTICLLSGLTIPECGCLVCGFEQIVDQLCKRKKNQSKEDS